MPPATERPHRTARRPVGDPATGLYPKLRGYWLFIVSMAAIKAHPEHHVQGDWNCHTGMCMAGWAGVLGGAKFLTGETSLVLVDIDKPAFDVAMVAADYLGFPQYGQRFSDTWDEYSGKPDEELSVADKNVAQLVNRLYDGCNDYERLLQIGADLYQTDEETLEADIGVILDRAEPWDYFQLRVVGSGR